MKLTFALLLFVLSLGSFSAKHGPSMPPDPWDPCCNSTGPCPPCK